METVEIQRRILEVGRRPCDRPGCDWGCKVGGIAIGTIRCACGTFQNEPQFIGVSVYDPIHRERILRYLDGPEREFDIALREHYGDVANGRRPQLAVNNER